MNEITLYFSSNHETPYYPVSGSVFTDEFNETLGSATIVLDNISHSDRLTNLESYEYVEILKSNDNGEEVSFMLVDNFVEKIQNIVDDVEKTIYHYDISLMSETKLLEKIQLPNLAITHSLVNGQKTIYDYIIQYMTLYNPKVKMITGENTWEYTGFIKIDNEKLKNRFGNTKCADLSLSKPTLRQLLTSLMIQEKCIPIIKNRTLDFIDFTEKPTIFEKDETINFIVKSQASDSFINTIVSTDSQVLSSDNYVLSETIGFRDKNSVLLKQKENLKLETRFPIYNVKEFKLNLQASTTLNYEPINTVDMFHGSGESYESFYPVIKISTPTLNGNNVIFSVEYLTRKYTSSNTTTRTHECTIRNAKFVITQKKTHQINRNIYTWYEKIGETTAFANGITLPIPSISSDTSVKTYIYSDGTMGSSETITASPQGIYYHLDLNILISPIAGLTSNDIYIWLQNDLVDNVTQEKFTQFVPLNNGNYTQSFTQSVIGYLNKIDITPLIVENAKRQLLDTNFDTMPANGTIENLTKWIYGTVGYTIGSKEISGFSQTYNKAVAWWSNDYTYIENIMNFLKNNDYLKGDDVNITSVENFLGGMPYEYNTYKRVVWTPLYNSENFGDLYFDIKYQPINSYNLKYVKTDRDLPLLIEQLDSASNGLVDFERNSANEQEKVNRLGNGIISINQVTSDVTKIKPLNSAYDDYIIFKRVMAVENNYYQVNYYGSKNYVMQNYFTSITTKYRAYEYVDYNQSVTRKENDTIFVLISRNKITNGDKKIKLRNNNAVSLFASGLRFDITNTNKIIYSYEKDSANAFKNDISVIHADNMMAFIYENYDNVSSGLFLRSLAPDNSLGGIVQEWIILASDYFESHEVGYLSYIPFYETPFYFMKTPLITDLNYEQYIQFNLVDDNTSESLKKTYYKDNAEIINQSLQFIYYTDDESIKWTELFIANNKFVSDGESMINGIVDISNKDFSLSKENNKIGTKISAINYFKIKDYITFNNDNFVVNWASINLLLPQLTQFKFVHTNSDGSWSDVIGFKKIENKSIVTYYVSLNDTKTLKAFNEDLDGLIFLDNQELQ